MPDSWTSGRLFKKPLLAWLSPSPYHHWLTINNFCVSSSSHTHIHTHTHKGPFHVCEKGGHNSHKKFLHSVKHWPYLMLPLILSSSSFIKEIINLLAPKWCLTTAMFTPLSKLSNTSISSKRDITSLLIFRLISMSTTLTRYNSNMNATICSKSCE